MFSHFSYSYYNFKLFSGYFILQISVSNFKIIKRT